MHEGFKGVKKLADASMKAYNRFSDELTVEVVFVLCNSIINFLGLESGTESDSHGTLVPINFSLLVSLVDEGRTDKTFHSSDAGVDTRCTAMLS